VSRRARAGAGHDLLPRTAATAPPHTRLLRGGRPLARWAVRRRFAVALHHVERVPTSGGVVLAANHVGIADGPILAVFGPRPVHALTKQEIFAGPLGTLLRAGGQLPVDRFHVDTAAVRSCVRVLRDGGTVGVFPEGRRGAGDLGRFHRGAAYLALVTGAPVVPVILLGTREPGAGAAALPPRGGRVEVVYGDAVRLVEGPQPWPRTREQVARASLLLRERMLATLDEARMLTGRDLPGPLPPGELEDDPHTGVVEQGAS
jgi:1-acyl-sn-glycerol-3-phosphate acyltransferase